MANPIVVNNGLHVDAVGGVGVTSAQMARTAQSAMVAHDGAGPRLGVFYEGTPILVGGTSVTAPSMLVSVVPLAFACQKALAEGVYIARNTGVIYVDIAAAPASNSRIDVVYAMQRDKNSTTSPDGVSQGEIGVVTGTAAVSPTKPAIPAGAIEVGTVTVAAGVTATSNAGCTIATTCQWTTGVGSAIPVRNDTEQAALTQYDGLKVDRLDWNYVSRSDGTNWVPQVPTVTVATAGIVGGTAPVGAKLIQYAASMVATTSAGGHFQINFPATFPNGVLSVVVANGDDTAVANVTYGRTAVTTSSSTHRVRTANTAATVNSTNMRVDYVVTGW